MIKKIRRPFSRNKRLSAGKKIWRGYREVKINSVTLQHRHPVVALTTSLKDPFEPTKPISYPKILSGYEIALNCRGANYWCNKCIFKFSSAPRSLMVDPYGYDYSITSNMFARNKESYDNIMIMVKCHV